jgi:hypothetical protein
MVCAIKSFETITEKNVQEQLKSSVYAPDFQEVTHTETADTTL